MRYQKKKAKCDRPTGVHWGALPGTGRAEGEPGHVNHQSCMRLLVRDLFFFNTEAFNDNAAGVACTAAEEKPLSEESDENSPDSNPCPHTRYRVFYSRFLPILTGSGQFNVLPRTLSSNACSPLTHTYAAHR